MSLILRSLTALAAPAGPRSRLSVFYFHRVLEKPDPLLPSEPDARMFDRMLDWIGSQFRVLDPLDACERLYEGTLPSRPAVITFDDGYLDNCTVALPILRRKEMKAAFFIATSYLQGGAMFNDRVIESVRRWNGGSLALPMSDEQIPVRTIDERRAAIERLLLDCKYRAPSERECYVSELERRTGCNAASGGMMFPEHVAALASAGMRLGGHTRSHPILARIDDQEARREINGGRDDLAEILGQRPEIFAYPNGKFGADFEARHMKMVAEAGYRFAFTTDPAPATAHSDRMAIPRFTPWDRTGLKFRARAYLNLSRSAA